MMTLLNKIRVNINFKKIALCIITLVIHLSVARGQSLDLCLQHLINQDYHKADSCIQQIQNKPLKAYLQHYLLFISQATGNDNYEHYTNSFDAIADKIKESINYDEHCLAYLSEIYLQKGIVEFRNNNYISAITAFSKAHNYWEDSEDEHPELKENLKLRGIFNLLISKIPNSYTQLAGWFGLSGDNKTGLKTLHQYYNTPSLNKGQKLEALLYLGFAQLKFDENNDNTRQLILSELHNEHPEIIRSVIIRCAFKIKEPRLCNEWLYADGSINFMPLLYLKGKYFTLINDYRAPGILKEFLNRNQSEQFVADAYRYLSWYYFLQNDLELYKQYNKTVQTLKSFPTWEDKQAHFESTLAELPDTILLKSRLLFDMGDFQQCLDKLSESKPDNLKNLHNQTEFYYRKGRCYQMLQQYNLAEINFTEAIKINDNSIRYFAPYSALCAARINMSSGNIQKAEHFISEAHRLNKYENKSSINQEIKELENQLKKL